LINIFTILTQNALEFFALEFSDHCVWIIIQVAVAVAAVRAKVPENFIAAALRFNIELDERRRAHFVVLAFRMFLVSRMMMPILMIASCSKRIFFEKMTKNK
jgi:hypothetical protein